MNCANSGPRPGHARHVLSTGTGQGRRAGWGRGAGAGHFPTYLRCSCRGGRSPLGGSPCRSSAPSPGQRGPECRPRRPGTRPASGTLPSSPAFFPWGNDRQKVPETTIPRRPRGPLAHWAQSARLAAGQVERKRPQREPRSPGVQGSAKGKKSQLAFLRSAPPRVCLRESKIEALEKKLKILGKALHGKRFINSNGEGGTSRPEEMMSSKTMCFFSKSQIKF